ncbi:MAG: PepSY domain-containing protein [Planctomycetaceae bacterium]|nr:PepSY domain-containing protein [Planctomycetaceae bacterium]
MGKTLRNVALVMLLAMATVASASVYAGEGRISEESARQAALAQVDGGRMVRSEIDRKRGGRIVYEYTIDDDDNRYRITIDGDTGETIEFSRKAIRRDRRGDVRAETSGRISLDDAQQIALDRVGGGDVVEAKYKSHKRNRGRYEFEIIHNGYEYDIEIDAETGDVVKFEQDDR